MAKIKISSDPFLRVRSIKKIYRQCRNLVMDCNGAQEAGLTCGPTTGSDTLPTWSPNEHTNGQIVAGPESNTYTSTVLSYQPETTVMYSQNISSPIQGHIYYGGCYFYSDAGFTAGDGRFEWYYSDAGQTLVFANRISSTNGQWVLYSARVTAPAIQSNTGWRIRNFIVNGTSTCYSCKHIIIDLTDTFGAGHEPSKEWCDKAIREWRTFDGFNVESTSITKENYRDYFTPLGGGTYTAFDYEALDSPQDPREPSWLRSIPAGTGVEAYVYNNVSKEIAGMNLEEGHYTYVAFNDYFRSEKEWNIEKLLSHDVYSPEAEPVIGTVNIGDTSSYTTGGSCRNHGRMSLYNDNRGFIQNNALVRIDINLGADMKQAEWRFYNPFWVNLSDNCTLFQKYQARFGGTAPLASTVSKEWCDYWINGKSIPLIHIGDDTVKVGFDKDYNLVCNDVEIHPEIDGVYLDDSGVILCQGVIWGGTAVANWVDISLPDSTSTLYDIAYFDGKYFISDYTAPRIYYGTDLKSLNSIENVFGAGDTNGVTKFVASENRLIISGGYGRCAYIDKGSLTPVPVTSMNSSEEASDLTGGCYAKGRFFVGGESGRMFSSPDGINWTSVTHPYKYAISDIVCSDNGRLVCGGGYYNKVAYSDDGDNWTLVDITGFDKQYLHSIKYYNGLFIAVSFNNKATYSSDGINWTLVSDLKFKERKPTDIAYGGGYYVVVGQSGKASYSTNMVGFSELKGVTYNPNSLQRINFINGMLIAVGSKGQISYCPF